MGTFIAISPYKKIVKIVLDDGTEIDTSRNIMSSEYVSSNVISHGGLFLITITLSPKDFKKLIKDNGDENTE